MTRQKRQTSESMLLPLRIGMQRGSYFLFILVSIGLIALSRVEGALVDRVTSNVLGVVGPVLSGLATPVATVRHGLDEVENFFNVYADNERLREENARLLRWQSAAYRLEQENAAFRSILRFNPDPRVAYVTARVVGEAGGPFVKTRLVNAGYRLGLGPGMAVLTGEGLAGRVVQTSRNMSRILLLTDLNSRVPVAVVGARHRAILVGDNDEPPRLEFHAGGGDRINPGDRIVTSGDGGLFPAGLIVGDVIAGAEGQLRVRLAADLNRLDVVRVARYSMPELVLEEQLTPAAPQTALPAAQNEDGQVPVPSATDQVGSGD